jgi:hypothetical protein
LRVGIFGLGGTGSYVLDFFVKTPEREIHLFESDTLASRIGLSVPDTESIPTSQFKFARTPGAVVRVFLRGRKVLSRPRVLGARGSKRPGAGISSTSASHNCQTQIRSVRFLLYGFLIVVIVSYITPL